jgi:2-dehydro-3-deoxyglucarate aldolase
MANIVKEKLSAGKVTLGAWVMVGHPASGEIQAACGFDWVAVDTEHTSIGFETLENIIRAIERGGAAPFVRMPGHDPITIKRTLDIGARGIIVPMVNSAQQARDIVAAAKFPPVGERGASFCRPSGYGDNFKGYYDAHNEDICVVAMVEHVDAVANIDEIVRVEGVDALFMGPYDLSSSMGIVGEFDNPRFEEALMKVREAAKKAGMPVGLHVVPPDIEQIRQRAAEGFQFIACSIDTQMILSLGKQMARALD